MEAALVTSSCIALAVPRTWSLFCPLASAATAAFPASRSRAPMRTWYEDEGDSRRTLAVSYPTPLLAPVRKLGVL